MTHAAPRRPTRFPRVWLLPLGAVLLIVVATSIELVSRSILIDLVAWGPLWVGLALLVLITRGRRLGRIRVSGLLSLSLLALMVVFVVAHLQGWDIMPSSVGRLDGSPDAGVATAALSARMDGVLTVRVGATGALYMVSPLRTGGDVGVPTAFEQSQDDAISVELTAPLDPGLYQFAGWDLVLSPTPLWTLSFRGGLDVDLRSLQIESIQLQGAGIVRLGAPNGSVPASVDGDISIEVPRGVAVRVIGPADVPDGWSSSSGSWTSPHEGPGWVIAVSEGSSVRITER